MLIPPQRIQNELSSDGEKGGEVRLKSAHLLIDKNIAVQVFAGEPNVNLVYYAERRTLMLAPATGGFPTVE